MAYLVRRGLGLGLGLGLRWCETAGASIEMLRWLGEWLVLELKQLRNGWKGWCWHWHWHLEGWGQLALALVLKWPGMDLVFRVFRRVNAHPFESVNYRDRLYLQWHEDSWSWGVGTTWHRGATGAEMSHCWG
ncbi:hypothetical protein SCLCIDRAFT_8755 [Scleroderma citrinum Foug A]|uniref:Uncharacterized protein n=1 Tax=Scleroderma citrinum Foug A TaxID=1036808 RepID=A0A0C3AF55_9AGAM|nr:hypothetical protein SCLCIDRAFT_8755 [Scleroderma citrinum Foug A]